LDPLRLALIFLYPALCLWMAWTAYSLIGVKGIIGVCVLGSAGSGYLWYRSICSGGLSCDVGDYHDYLWRLGPWFAAFAILALGIACAFLVLTARRISGKAPPRWAIALAYAMAVLVHFSVAALVDQLHLL
jgi:hypothetical protein